MKKLNQKAFSHIEILIVGVVIALVGAIGYTVWQRSSSSNPDSQAAAGYPVDPQRFPNGVTYSVNDDTKAGPPGRNNEFFKKSKYKYKTVLKSGPLDVRACRTSKDPSKAVKVRAFWNNENLQSLYTKYLAKVKADGAFWIKTNGQYQLVTDVPRDREVQPPKKITDNPASWNYILTTNYSSVNTRAQFVFMQLPAGQVGGGPGQFPNASKKVFWDGGGYSESNIYSHKTGEFAGVIRNLKEHPQFRNDSEREQARIWYQTVTGKSQVSLSKTNPLAFFFVSYEDKRTPQTIRWIHVTGPDGKIQNVQAQEPRNIKNVTKYIKFLNIPRC